MAINRLQLTLAILKPDVIANPLIVEEIEQRLLSCGFLFLCKRKLTLTRCQAKKFYVEHKERFFYNRLVTYMSSGPILAAVLCHENAIAQWRMMLGNTKVYRTIYDDPGSIRGSHGLTDTRNCAHGSDSSTSAAKEISIFFPDFDIEQWYNNTEIDFRLRHVTYNESNGLHERLS